MLRYLILLCFSYVFCQHLQLPEGAPCSWNGVSGQCVNIFRCFHAKMDIEKKDNPPICNYQDKIPIICCTDCELVNDTRLILISPELGILEKSGQNKAKDKCLDFIYTLKYPCKGRTGALLSKTLNTTKNCYEVSIVKNFWEPASIGGRSAEREEFPHMALLGYGDSVETAEWLCAGSVISERFILTAGHCLSSPSVGPVKYIALGILKRTDPPELWLKYNVKTAIRHPDYKPPSKYNDIALLETDKDISFDSRVRPACLHVDDEVDGTAYATGWGALGPKKALADTLQSVTLSMFSEEECSKYYPRHRHLLHGYNHTTQMCYGDKFDIVDTCEGDSGGPLQSRNHEQCVYTILGVTSYGRQCGASAGSGMYTRVAYYVRWIEDIVWA